MRPPQFAPAAANQPKGVYLPGYWLKLATRPDSVRLFTFHSLPTSIPTLHGSSCRRDPRDARLRGRSFVTFCRELAKSNDVEYMEYVDNMNSMID